MRDTDHHILKLQEWMEEFCMDNSHHYSQDPRMKCPDCLQIYIDTIKENVHATVVAPDGPVHRAVITASKAYCDECKDNAAWDYVFCEPCFLKAFAIELGTKGER